MIFLISLLVNSHASFIGHQCQCTDGTFYPKSYIEGLEKTLYDEWDVGDTEAEVITIRDQKNSLKVIVCEYENKKYTCRPVDKRNVYGPYY